VSKELIMQPLSNSLAKGSNDLTATNVKKGSVESTSTVPKAEVEEPKSTASTKLSISEEGYNRLAREQAVTEKNAAVRAAGKEVAENLNGSTTETEESKSKDPIDQLIEKIQEQIEEVKKQLARLEADDSEAAQIQKEVLSKQLLELNNQLVSLIEQKVQSLKSSAS